MKAVVYTQFGPPEVLQLEDVKTPEPKEHEVLIRIYALLALDSKLKGDDEPDKVFAAFVSCLFRRNFFEPVL